jgi:hypothetical protein
MLVCESPLNAAKTTAADYMPSPSRNASPCFSPSSMSLRGFPAELADVIETVLQRLRYLNETDLDWIPLGHANLVQDLLGQRLLLEENVYYFNKFQALKQRYVADHLIATVHDFRGSRRDRLACLGIDLDNSDFVWHVFAADKAWPDHFLYGWVVREQAIPVVALPDLNRREK